jgi:hypothetical protein
MLTFNLLTELLLPVMRAAALEKKAVAVRR